MIKTIFLKELKININTLKIKSIFYKKKKLKHFQRFTLRYQRNISIEGNLGLNSRY